MLGSVSSYPTLSRLQHRPVALRTSQILYEGLITFYDPLNPSPIKLTSQTLLYFAVVAAVLKTLTIPQTLRGFRRRVPYMNDK